MTVGFLGRGILLLSWRSFTKSKIIVLLKQKKALSNLILTPTFKR